jgi:hypothetical protein
MPDDSETTASTTFLTTRSSKPMAASRSMPTARRESRLSRPYVYNHPDNMLPRQRPSLRSLLFLNAEALITSGAGPANQIPPALRIQCTFTRTAPRSDLFSRRPLRVVQRLFHRRVRQVEPLLQKIDAQHALHAHRRPPVTGVGRTASSSATRRCTRRARASSGISGGRRMWAWTAKPR